MHSLEQVEVKQEPEDQEVIDWIVPEADTTAGYPDKDMQFVEPPPLAKADKDWERVKSKAAKKKQKKILDKCNDACCNLGLLESIQEDNEVNAVGEWEELLMAVDSGATETVVSDANAKTVPTTESKTGGKYRMANGDIIDNEGEKQMVMSSGEGVNRLITAQVTEVSKPLLSVSKMVKAGNTVVFAPEGSYIYDGYTGEVMNLEEQRGMYMLKVWIKPASGFQGFGGNP